MSGSLGWYNGKDSLSNNEKPALLQADKVEYSQIDGDGTYYQYTDEGSILFRLASGVNTDDIPAGEYSSFVYFHVVSEE